MLACAIEAAVICPSAPATNVAAPWAASLRIFLTSFPVSTSPKLPLVWNEIPTVSFSAEVVTTHSALSIFLPIKSDFELVKSIILKVTDTAPNAFTAAAIESFVIFPLLSLSSMTAALAADLLSELTVQAVTLSTFLPSVSTAPSTSLLTALPFTNHFVSSFFLKASKTAEP